MLYPQISIGGALNRTDNEFLSLLPDSVIYNGDTLSVPRPVTNWDGFLGFTLPNGGMLGSHIYVAIQEGAPIKNGVAQVGERSANVSTYALKGDLGFNWPLARNIDGELSFGAGWLQFGPSSINGEVSIFAKARAFSTVALINGELVPIVQYSSINGPGQSRNNFKAGLGVNASLDRGFFWLGVEGFFNSSEQTGYQLDTVGGGSTILFDANATRKNTLDVRGLSVSFGIERNIWWDWLVVRVGGKKDFNFNYLDNKDYYTDTNPIADGTQNDHVGFGIGVNIEEKLKVDATLAEDLLYTGGNLFSGPAHHVISRISATYSF